MYLNHLVQELNSKNISETAKQFCLKMQDITKINIYILAIAIVC